MKKLFSLILGVYLLIFTGCSFEFNSSEKQITWEYKQITSYGEAITKDYGNNSFDSVTKQLNDLGKEGWELVGVHSKIETVFPNFGNQDYHTGIKNNIRTNEIIYTFKREVKKQKNK